MILYRICLSVLISVDSTIEWRSKQALGKRPTQEVDVTSKHPPVIDESRPRDDSIALQLQVETEVVHDVIGETGRRRFG